MPKPPTITKAFLQKIKWDNEGTVVQESQEVVPVQFNPESLKLAFSNQLAGDKNKGGSAIQFSSRGTTKLSFEMWFDVTAQTSAGKREKDVRKLTEKVTAFMQTTESGTGRNTKYTPPGCRFQWGTFLFEGVMESVNETLEFFSESGEPLRASVSVSLVKQDVKVRYPAQGRQGSAGTRPQQQARDGDSVQAMSARQGCEDNWQERAQEQGVEDPLRMRAGSSLPSGQSSIGRE
jgi:hypothetical protein